MRISFSFKTIRNITACAGLATALPASAQVLNDNFASDSALAPNWFNINNSSSTAFTLNPSPGQGLALTMTSSGKVNEQVGTFSATSLAAVGDSISLSVTFNSPNLSGNTGGLLVGLHNSNGTPMTGNEVSGNLTGGTGGATADDFGYFGIFGYNTSAGTSSKIYSRPGGNAAANNELGYYSLMTSSTQLSSLSAQNNANLANNTPYTFLFTVTKGITGNQINASILDQNAATLGSWSATDTGAAANSFDELVFGFYGKNQTINGNITSVLVTVPEPSALALVGLGLAGTVLRRRSQPKA